MNLGLALAGGGLKGVAYIGVFKALNELGVKPSFISGTSSGSIFATMYAQGIEIDELKEITKEYYKVLTQVNKGRILKAGMNFFTKKSLALEGLIDGKLIEDIVTNVSKERNIENISDIKMPLAICTVDIKSTKECIFLSNKYQLFRDDVDYIYDAPIGVAVRASMSFPGIFTTCNYKCYNFIDGGTKDNLPVQILRDIGAEKILSFNFKLDEYLGRKNILSVLLRAVDIFSLKDVIAAQKISDVAIEIDVEGTSLLEIDDIDKVVSIGYNAVIKNREKVMSLLNGEVKK